MKQYFVTALTACSFFCVLMSFQPAAQKTQAVKPAGDMKASIDRGKAIYTRKCLVCHQVDGGGVPHLNAPLDGASQVVGKDKARLIKIVLNGMSEKVELDGEIYANVMLPQKDLSDQDIADVLTYVRNSWTNKASAVAVAEVKAVRSKK